MSEQPFIARYGLGIRNATAESHILNGQVDPSIGSGVVAPVSSIYLRENGSASTIYIKFGVVDTDWKEYLFSDAITTGSVLDVDGGSSVDLDNVLTNQYRSIKWIVNVSKNNDLISFELHATSFNNQVTHNISSINKIGDPSSNISFTPDVNLIGVGALQEMVLSCTVGTDDVRVEFTRISVV